MSMSEHVCQDRSCATVCPKCGALCHIYNSLDGGIGKPFPQPDLTGIYEVYEKYKHLDGVLSDPYLDTEDDLPGHIRHELWQAIRKIFKENP